MHKRQGLFSNVIFSFWVLTAICLFSAFTYFVGARFEHADLTPASPSEAEKVRQELAIESTRIAAAAKNLDLPDLASSVENWGKTLGGIWVPWPSQPPAGYTNPEIDLAPRSTNIAELLGELQAFAKKLADHGFMFGDSAQSVLLAGEVLYQAEKLAQTAGLPSIFTDLAKPAITEIARQITTPSTVVAIDYAKQILEAHTALIPKENPQYEMNQNNISLLNSLINQALASGISDQRTSFYPPSTQLAQAKPVLSKALSKLAAENSTQTESAQSEEPVSAQTPANMNQDDQTNSAKTPQIQPQDQQDSLNFNLAKLIAILMRSF